MKRLVFLLLATVMPVLALAPQASDQQVASREKALALAGAFSNDGFEIRDGYWTGTIAPDEPKLIEVNLYAGNQYWFCVGAAESATRLAVNVYDENGRPLLEETYADGETAAAGFAPEISGPYYVRVQQTEGEAATFCMIYLYK